MPSNPCRRNTSTNTLEHAELGLRAQACFATQNLTLPIATQGVEDVAVDAVENISQTLDTGKPVLITGPAACGKSTLTKQYTHRIATKFLRGGGELVPLLVTVIELADTVKAAALGSCSRPLSATDDVLKMHIQRKFGHDQPLVDFLIDRRAAHKLVLVLDGMDEAGEARDVLEPYIATRLKNEVLLCLTGRENGIEDMTNFSGFEHFHIEALTRAQQKQIIASRMRAEAGGRKGEVTLDERARAWVAVAASSFCVSHGKQCHETLAMFRKSGMFLAGCAHASARLDLTD